VKTGVKTPLAITVVLAVVLGMRPLLAWRATAKKRATASGVSVG
jgi:hypothetical protein